MSFFICENCTRTFRFSQKSFSWSSNFILSKGPSEIGSQKILWFLFNFQVHFNDFFCSLQILFLSLGFIPIFSNRSFFSSIQFSSNAIISSSKEAFSMRLMVFLFNSDIFDHLTIFCSFDGFLLIWTSSSFHVNFGCSLYIISWNCWFSNLILYFFASIALMFEIEKSSEFHLFHPELAMNPNLVHFFLSIFSLFEWVYQFEENIRLKYCPIGNILFIFRTHFIDFYCYLFISMFLLTFLVVYEVHKHSSDSFILHFLSVFFFTLFEHCFFVYNFLENLFSVFISIICVSKHESELCVCVC